MLAPDLFKELSLQALPQHLVKITILTLLQSVIATVTNIISVTNTVSVSLTATVSLTTTSVQLSTLIQVQVSTLTLHLKKRDEPTAAAPQETGARRIRGLSWK
jgi:hypothetical protein